MKMLPGATCTYHFTGEPNNDCAYMSQASLWPAVPTQNVRCSASWGCTTRKRLAGETLGACRRNRCLAPWLNGKQGSPGEGNGRLQIQPAGWSLEPPGLDSDGCSGQILSLASEGLWWLAVSSTVWLSLLPGGPAPVTSVKCQHSCC